MLKRKVRCGEMKYTYIINDTPEVVEEKLHRSLSPMTRSCRIHETFLMHKLPKAICGKVENGKFDIADYTSFRSPDRLSQPRSMTFLHMTGKISKTDSGTELSFKFGYSPWQCLILLAFAILFVVATFLLSAVLGESGFDPQLKAAAIVLVLLVAVPFIMGILLGQQINKESKRLLREFITKLFEI